MEEQGLASMAMYGDGSGNTVKHYYAGDQSGKKNKSSCKENKMACKKKPGKK